MIRAFLFLTCVVFTLMIGSAQNKGLIPLTQKWVLVSFQNLESKSMQGYWNMYGIDILDISENQIIQTYSFFEGEPTSHSSFAYDIENKILHIFNEDQSSQNVPNKFTSSLKVVNLTEQNLTIRYILNNETSGISEEVAELHYTALKKSSLTFDYNLISKLLKDSEWRLINVSAKNEDHILSLSSKDSTYQILKGEQKAGGNWSCQKIGDETLLTFREFLSNKIIAYQIYHVTDKNLVIHCLTDANVNTLNYFLK